MAKFAHRKFGAASARHVFVVCCTGALNNVLRAPLRPRTGRFSSFWLFLTAININNLQLFLKM